MPNFFMPRKGIRTVKRSSSRSASKPLAKREFHTAKPNRVDQQGFSLSFNGRDYSNLCFDRYRRFHPNSPIIGNAVLHYNGKEVTASQYEMPSGAENAPQWQPLVDIQQVNRYGTTAYKAQTLDGVTLFSNRGYKFTDWNNRIHEIRPFSLHTSSYQEPYWGSSRLFSITETPVDEQIIRGGSEVAVEPHTIATRTTRSVSQKSVMHYTALQAFESFYIEYGSQLTAEMDVAFRRIINAEFRGSASSKFYPEWHHAVGHSLAPSWMNPQEKANLGGGPRWSNTMMMVLENLCRWHATQSQEVDVAITPTFFMLFASDLIEKIHYEASLSYRQRQIKFSHTIEPLRQIDPIIPQASDVAQITGITQSLFANVIPHLSTKVANADLKSIKSLVGEKHPEPFNQNSFRL
ncbi:hypothetical protein [Legionella shakespearei]|uniref:Uncharacterized protein n=1 Tax=Legionella shakespearei DSM 23087 TaxID=1122169 RepID=A0A0W0YQ96_9GAMM|nr:hypothetical protein [Legionella shakespearei]KTD58879.1 hypothetical protein Lsha_2097 [Legionella shakespearei DSM 23087]